MRSTNVADAIPIPANSSPLIPRLFCRDVPAEIDFCVRGLGAQELGRRQGQDGKTLHALLTLCGGMLMIEAEFLALPNRAPQPDGSSPVAIYLYVANVDEMVKRAVAAGAKILFPAKDQFWGDRTAWVMDPAGHVWTIATRIEETSAGQRQNRWEEIRKGS